MLTNKRLRFDIPPVFRRRRYDHGVTPFGQRAGGHGGIRSASAQCGSLLEVLGGRIELALLVKLKALLVALSDVLGHLIGVLAAT